jgi:hypothetical protein
MLRSKDRLRRPVLLSFIFTLGGFILCMIVLLSGNSSKGGSDKDALLTVGFYTSLQNTSKIRISLTFQTLVRHLRCWLQRSPRISSEHHQFLAPGGGKHHRSHWRISKLQRLNIYTTARNCRLVFGALHRNMRWVLGA